MTRIERKLLVRTGLIGVVLTLLVTLTHGLGSLAPFERWLYDRRARDNQRFTPAATNELIHVDIDDRALETIGKWPWKRSHIASIIDEISRAGAKAIALDVLFTEPQDLEIKRRRGKKDIIVDHDATLAAAIAKAGNVLLPIGFNILEPRPEAHEHAVALLAEDLELTEQQVRRQLKKRTESDGRGGGWVELDKTVNEWFFPARREAMYRRISRELGRDAGISVEQLRSILMPGTPPIVTGSVHLRILTKQFEKVRAMRILDRLARVKTANDTPVARAIGELPPIHAFSEAAAASAFVDFLPDADGVLRSVPLWIEHRDRWHPQFGLTLACMMLGVDIRDVELQARQVVIPRPDGHRMVIPVHTRYVQNLKQNVGLIMDVPWRGPVKDWPYMYDPTGKTQKNHLAITKIWETIDTRQKIINNNANLDEALKAVLSLIDEEKLQEFIAHPLSPNDAHVRKQIIERALHELKAIGWLEAIENPDPEQPLTRNELILSRSVDAMRRLPPHTAELADQLLELESVLRALKGRAVIIGWAATGAIADFVPTPLHHSCPGAVVHGVIFNGIMTEDVWRRERAWVALACTIMIGLLATAAVASLSPKFSLAAALILAGGYFLVNGIVLFDYANTIVGAAGPIVAVALVWSGCTLWRFIAERAERARVERRFRSYVDPALVDYVIEHPEQATLDGQIRELTVVFTDLAGFTSLSESMREKTVGILNEYMELMVPVIRQRHGYVNKFLGDGIMFFFGAPKANEHHAIDAVMTALKMQEVLEDFNKSLANRELPTVKMRMGVSSGNMVVGDAGSTDASDYTVLGDAVNVGARLESANKATGTWILINDRAAMLLEDMFLLRPIGRLQVIGKSQGVMTYEPLALAVDGREEQRQLVSMTNDIVNAYILGEFDKCREKAAHLEATCGPSLLTALYTRISDQFLRDPPGPDFVGQIILEEK